MAAAAQADAPAPACLGASLPTNQLPWLTCVLLLCFHTHSPDHISTCPACQVKNKMSKADFLRNNRGINDGGDLAQVRGWVWKKKRKKKKEEKKENGGLHAGASRLARAAHSAPCATLR